MGEMWKKPGARPMRFEATEDSAVDRVAFSWRARFLIAGPLAMRVVDEFAHGDGQLRVSLLGIPLQTQKGPETAVGEAMRYLAELAWAPYVIAANRELEWRDLDPDTVEVTCDVAATEVAVRWEFNDAGDLVRATGVRPFPVGKTYVPTPWGGDFGDYASFDGTRVPSSGEAWWDLAEGRFVYWRGRVTGIQLIRAGRPRTAMTATFRQTPLRRLGNVLITPLPRLGLAGKRTHILTVRGRKSGWRYSTPVQLVIENGRCWLVAPPANRSG